MVSKGAQRAIYPCCPGCDGGRLPEADTQEKGITGENDDVHTRTYRPFSCTGETALQRPGGRVKKALTTSVLPL